MRGLAGHTRPRHRGSHDKGPSGAESERFFTELVHRRPQTWRGHDLPAAWQLYEAVGARKLRAAFAACVRQGAFGSEYLAAYVSGVAQ